MEAPRLDGAGPPAARAARIFAALGEESRLRLIARLCEEGPHSIVGLTEGLPITRQAVAQHLAVLKAAGLAVDARSGRRRLWRVEADGLAEVRRYLALISTQWDDAAERLRAYVETGRN